MTYHCHIVTLQKPKYLTMSTQTVTSAACIYKWFKNMKQLHVLTQTPGVCGRGPNLFQICSIKSFLSRRWVDRSRIVVSFSKTLSKGTSSYGENSGSSTTDELAATFKSRSSSIICCSFSSSTIILWSMMHASTTSRSTPRSYRRAGRFNF